MVLNYILVGCPCHNNNSERMWGLKTTAVPAVMGALGTIKKDMEHYTNKIPGNINIQELQLSFLQPTFSGGSSPSSRNPLCHPKSMVWTQMLREKITRNYTSTSCIIIIIIMNMMMMMIMMMMTTTTTQGPIYIYIYFFSSRLITSNSWMTVR